MNNHSPAQSVELHNMAKRMQEYKEYACSLEHAIMRMEELSLAGKLAAGIAHEVRNPLTIIKGFIELLAPEIKKMGKETYTQTMLSEIDRVDYIIDDFLAVAKPSIPNPEEIVLIPFLEEISAMIQSEALLRNCTLQIDVKELHSSSTVHMDSQKMKQVFLNLFKNSFESIQESLNKAKGFVLLKVIQSKDCVEFRVEDNGRGIDEETKSNLFTPFFTTKEKGTGLGLSLCKQIIEQHRGSIDVFSKVNQGTTFTIVFPCSEKTIMN